MGTKEVKRIVDADWDNLLPGKEMAIGQTSFTIRPLGFGDFTSAIKKIESIQGKLTEAGVTASNYKKSDKLFSVASLIMSEIPEVLSEASGVHIEDLNRMPISIVIDIISQVIDVNIESQQGLSKNFSALAGKVRELMSGVGASQIQSSRSSRQATVGKK